MIISLLSFSNKLNSEVKKVLSVLQPSDLILVKENFEVQDFCYNNNISILNLENVGDNLYCKYLDVINQSELIIIDVNIGMNSMLEFCLDQCNDYKKNYMVFYNR